MSVAQIAWRRVAGLLALAALTGCVDIPDPTAGVDRGGPVGDQAAPGDMRTADTDARDVAVDMARAEDAGLAPDLAPDSALRLDMAPIVDMAPVVDMAPDLAPTPDMAPPLAALRIERVGRPGEEPLLLDPVPVGGASRSQVVLDNIGEVPLTILPGVRLDPGQRGDAFAVDRLPQAVQLEPGESRVLVVVFTPVEPGPASAALLVQRRDGVSHRVGIGAVAYHDAHVVLAAGGADAQEASVSHGTYTGGAAWDARALPATLGRFVDAACGGVCRADGDPAGPSDARCIVVGEQGGDGMILTTDDGARWVEAQTDGRPPPFLGVDYGPPWYAVTTERTLWTSEDGTRWQQSEQFGQARGLPRDLAVDRDGQVFIVGAGGARWWVPARNDGLQVVAETLTRVADSPDGNFLAVGEGGRWVHVDPDGAGATATEIGVPDLTDVAVGFAPGESGWTAVSPGRVYRMRQADMWPVAAAGALERVAVGEQFALGVGGGTVYRFDPDANTYAPLATSPPWAMTIAAGRVCPDAP